MAFKKSKKAKKLTTNERRYITRQMALRRLQVSLKDFRRLCILKGVYPRDPKRKPRGSDKVYYLTKDINYLSHERIIGKFRENKVFLKRLKRLRDRREPRELARAMQNRPMYTLDHLVKERYPSFVDAVRDIDDALCMVHLFANLPAKRHVNTHRTENCARLASEFQYYVIQSRSLVKTFLSIKGIYYQADIQGQLVTWIVPYRFSQRMPKDVDFDVMGTFLEFYETLLSFVNYKLFQSLGLHYPPKLSKMWDTQGFGAHMIEGGLRTAPEHNSAAHHPGINKAKATVRVKSGAIYTNSALQDKVNEAVDMAQQENMDVDDTDKKNATENGEAKEDKELVQDIVNTLHGSGKEFNVSNTRNLFSGLTIFVSRECPWESLVFVIPSCGGQVAWEGDACKIKMDDPSITHQIVDRPSLTHKYVNRTYIQPQWIYDCLNAGILLPVEEYLPGVSLPAHLSPWVDDEEVGYIPGRRKEVARLVAQARGEDMDEEDDGDDDESVIEEDEEEEENDSENDDDEEVEEEEEEKEEEEEEEDEKKKDKGRKRKAPAPKLSKTEKAKAEAREKEELAEIMMSRKDKHLYNQIQYGKAKKQAAAQELMDRRKKAAKQKQAQEGAGSAKKKAKK